MNNEMLAMLEYLQRERGLERETIIRAVEDALAAAARKTVRDATDLRVEIDRKTLDSKTFAKYKVVDLVRSPGEEILLADARRLKADSKVGDTVEVEKSPGALGRIAAQTAKQAIMQRIRQAERERMFEEYKNSPGEIVSGTVRRFERSDVVVELERAEATMPGSERPVTEQYQVGDRIRALVLKVDNTSGGPMIVLSRSHPDFVRRLFALEVSEISDGTVEIRGIAREPGFRTKLAVASRDEKVDPVGACVGMRGMRVKNIVRELSGEKIDIVRWHEDIKQYVSNALQPAKLTRVTADEVTRTVNVVVAADQLSLAIGKKGQNARLTSKLSGWRVDIEREAADVTFEEKVAKAIAELAGVEGIGPQKAEALVQAGFLTLEGILAADTADLEAVEGFDAAAAAAAHRAAEAAYERKHGVIES
jgi:N utilization substance protein A